MWKFKNQVFFSVKLKNQQFFGAKIWKLCFYANFKFFSVFWYASKSGIFSHRVMKVKQISSWQWILTKPAKNTFATFAHHMCTSSRTFNWNMTFWTMFNVFRKFFFNFLFWLMTWYIWMPMSQTFGAKFLLTLRTSNQISHSVKYTVGKTATYRLILILCLQTLLKH